MKERLYSEVAIMRGQQRLISVPIGERSKRVFRLMEEDSIVLDFYSRQAIAFRLGDYIDDEIFGRFVIADLPRGSYEVQNAVYRYELTFVAEYMQWKNYMFMLTYKPIDFLEGVSGDETRKESTWNYTAALADHLDRVLDNLRILGIHGYSYDVSGCKDASRVRYLSYQGVSIIEGLNAIAEEFECEWWVYGKVIYFGKCEQAGESMQIDTARDITSLNIQDNRSGYANCIYAYGSDKNVPESYRKNLYLTVNGVQQEGDHYELSCTPQITGDMFAGASRYPNLEFHFKGGANFTAQSGKAVWVGEKRISSSNSAAYNITIPGVRTYDLKFQLMGISAGSWVRAYVQYFIVDKHNALVYGNTPIYKKTFEINVPSNLIVPVDKHNFPGTTLVGFNIPANSEYQIRTEIGIENFAEGASAQVLSGGFIRYYTDKPLAGVEEYTAIATPTDTGEVKGCYLTYINEGEERKIYADINSNKVVVSYGDIGSIAAGTILKVDTTDSLKIPASYFVDTLQDPTSVLTIGANRLRLPEALYPDGCMKDSGIDAASRIERTVVFDDIYPKMKLFVRAVETEKKKDDDTSAGSGATSYWNWTEYTLQLETANGTPFDFKDDFVLAGNELKVQFLSASDVEGLIDSDKYSHLVNGRCRLAGMKFGAKHTRADGKSTFTVVRNEDFGARLPNDTLLPQEGDPVALIGWNIKAVESSGITESAELELEQRTKAYKDALANNPFTFTLTLTPDYMFEQIATARLRDSNGSYIKDSRGRQLCVQNPMYYELLSAGQKATIIDATLYGGECQSRVIGYEYKLDRPWDNPQLTIGETQAFSRLAQIEKKITSK